MRKWLIFLLAVSLALISGSAYAQGGVTIKTLRVQLWPEYDQPGMLVMYTFSLSEDAPLPANIQVRIPSNATIHAVAKTEADTMVNVPYDAPPSTGDWVTVTMTVEDLSEYRIELYQPIEKLNGTRDFVFEWQSEYAVQAMDIQFQQPPGATNFTSAPTFPNMTPASDGIVYYTLSQGAVAAGDDFSISLSYQKDNDNLTVSAMPVEAPGVQNDSGEPFALTESLPMILVSAGVLLIVGGLLYFFLTGRGNAEPKQRKRHSASPSASGGDAYCHECGQRARPNDKFCRSCGAKIRL